MRNELQWVSKQNVRNIKGEQCAVLLHVPISHKRKSAVVVGQEHAYVYSNQKHSS